jgi:two-component SAPR family response regulator
MQHEAITSLSQDAFRAKTDGRKLILLYPWSTYKNAFLAHIVNDPERDLIYYRLPYMLPQSQIPFTDMLRHMHTSLSNELENFGHNLGSVIDTADPAHCGTALAADLSDYSQQRQRPVLLYMDEVDKTSQNDEQFRVFVMTLIDQIPEGVQVAISSRLLRYQPWYDLVASGKAIVLGTERRSNDVMYTVVDNPKPALEIYALGRGYAIVNGEEITNWDGALPRNLFFYFVDHKLVTRDQIFEVFWPKLTTKEATNVFHVTKRKISERITMKVVENGNYELTQYGSGFYTPSDKVIRYYDVEEFEASIHKAMTTVDEEEENRLLRRAVDLYKGPFLQDGKMEWMVERRDELRQLYAQALIGMGRLCRHAGKDLDALGYFIRSLKETPEREDIHREVMSIYIENGMMDDARYQYHLLEQTLDDSLGIGPSRESRDLYDMVLSRV